MNNYRKFLLHLSLIFVFFTTSNFDCGNTNYLIKLSNLSNTKVLVYIQEYYSDTLFTNRDVENISAGLSSEFYDPIAPTIDVNKSEFANGKPYGDKKYWEQHVKGDTLTIYLFDKNKLVTVKNIPSSILQVLHVNYTYLKERNFIVVYR